MKPDPILHHSIIVNINGESFGLKDKRKAGPRSWVSKANIGVPISQPDPPVTPD